jgi:hypothetical protein
MKSHISQSNMLRCAQQKVWDAATELQARLPTPISTGPTSSHDTLTQQTEKITASSAMLLLTAEALVTEPGGQDTLLPLPKGLPQVPNTVTGGDVALLLVALLSALGSVTEFTREPGTLPRTV